MTFFIHFPVKNGNQIQNKYVYKKNIEIYMYIYVTFSQMFPKIVPLLFAE